MHTPSLNESLHRSFAEWLNQASADLANQYLDGLRWTLEKMDDAPPEDAAFPVYLVRSNEQDANDILSYLSGWIKRGTRPVTVVELGPQ